MAFVKETGFHYSSETAQTSSSDGHQAGDIVLIFASVKGAEPEPQINIAASIYSGSEPVSLGRVYSSAGSPNQDIQMKIWVYSVADQSALTFALLDQGKHQAINAVIYRGVETPTGYLASTYGEYYNSADVSIQIDTVAADSVIVGIIASGADTQTELFTNEGENSFSGQNLNGITLRAANNLSSSSGIGLYAVDATAQASFIGPLTATAKTSDNYHAASIELVPVVEIPPDPDPTDDASQSRKWPRKGAIINSYQRGSINQTASEGRIKAPRRTGLIKR